MSSILKTFSGQCPKDKAYRSINVDYIEVTSLDSPTSYIKGRFPCASSMNCNHVSECPLYSEAPEKF